MSVRLSPRQRIFCFTLDETSGRPRHPSLLRVLTTGLGECRNFRTILCSALAMNSERKRRVRQVRLKLFLLFVLVSNKASAFGHFQFKRCSRSAPVFQVILATCKITLKRWKNTREKIMNHKGTRRLAQITGDEL